MLTFELFHFILYYYWIMYVNILLYLINYDNKVTFIYLKKGSSFKCHELGPGDISKVWKYNVWRVRRSGNGLYLVKTSTTRNNGVLQYTYISYGNIQKPMVFLNRQDTLLTHHSQIFMNIIIILKYLMTTT